MINKGTAVVGFIMCFLAGMFLMWGIDRKNGVSISAEGSEAAAMVDQSDSPVPVTSKDPSWGKADAPVTVVVFSDFQCPFCTRVNPTMEQVKKEYGPDKVRVVWKNNPLPFHQQAKPAAEAAATVFALGGNDAFWKFHDLVFQNQSTLTDDNYQKWAVQSGVDGAKFKEAYSGKKYASKVDQDLAEGSKAGVNGTPGFRVNGVEISGAQPFAKFKEVIDAQLAEAQKLIAAGTKPSQVYTTLTKKNAQAAPPPPAAAEKPAQPAEDTTIWAVPVMKDDPIKGKPDALVTIVEFSEFECPFCARVGDTLKKVVETYGDDVRIVWKDNPLPFHQNAKPAATVAREVYKQKGDAAFFKVHDFLFANQRELNEATYQKAVAEAGVPWPMVKAALDSGKHNSKFEESQEIGQDYNAGGTPHFFINGYRLAGAQPFEKFKEVIDARLAVAKALVAKGTPRAQVFAELMKEGKQPPPPEKKEVAAPDADSAFKGGANAKVVIQVFSDFQCPFCKRVNPTIAEIEKTYGSKVKVVWRHMPLPFHEDAPLASQAAQEAFAQKGNEGFWKFHDALFAGQSDIKRPALEKIATDLGLDMAKFKQALDTNKHKAKVDKDMKVAQDAGIQGTPASVINGYFVSGAQPFAAFNKVIKRALGEAR
ncbi:MAG: thioredoxin domain-containing protein [Polyangiaceae bacterium]|nr:thioredoxin domain-containing protein [Polyangiaceae bacterium]